jgi:hypothetical protein
LPRFDRSADVGPGWFGGGPQVNQQQQQANNYQQAQAPRKSGVGMGGMLAAG